MTKDQFIANYVACYIATDAVTRLWYRGSQFNEEVTNNPAEKHWEKLVQLCPKMCNRNN